jgi:hypothetical protein
MPAKGFDPKKFALVYAETGNATLALRESGAKPDKGDYNENWAHMVANRYKGRAEVQDELVKIYSRKAAMEYADCLPLAAGKVKEFLTADLSSNPKAFASQAALGAKILQDANIALGGSEYKQPVIANRNELVDQLSTLILADKGLIEQIIGRTASVVDGTAARVVSGEVVESSEVLPTLPETAGISERGEDQEAEVISGGEPLR